MQHNLSRLLRFVITLWLSQILAWQAHAMECDGSGQGAGVSIYLGQKTPGPVPQIFAPGVVSLPDSHELNAVFSPDGKEFYFSRKVGAAYKTLVIKQDKEGLWKTPELASFSKTNVTWDEVDVWLSRSGQELFYISNAPARGFAKGSVNIWRVRRNGVDWGEPHVLPRPVNSDYNELFPVTTNRDVLYFVSDRPDGLGERDLYLATKTGSQFDKIVGLGPQLNTPERESDAFVSADEEFMIVTSERTGGLGGADLYLSRRNNDGEWGDLVNMGAPLNSASHDYAPIVTADGQYIFFSRGGDIYWVAADSYLN